MITHSSILAYTVDRGAWWAAVHRVAESRTRLKRRPESTGSLPCGSQSLPSSDGWSSLKETWRNKTGHQQDCQIILPGLSHSLGVKIDTGCEQLGGEKVVIGTNF